jgi:hypothetical protein
VVDPATPRPMSHDHKAKATATPATTAIKACEITTRASKHLSERR